MDQLFQKLQKPSKLLAVILLLVAAGCALLVDLGNFGDAFMPVLGALFFLMFDVALTGVVALLLLLGKTDLAKKALFPIFAFWLFSSIYSYLNSAAWITKGVNGLLVTVCVFQFLTALVLIGALVLFLLGAVGKLPSFSLAWTLIAAALALIVLTMILRIVLYGVNDYGWVSFFDAFRDGAFAFGLFFASLALKEAPEAGSEPTETADDEPVQE